MADNSIHLTGRERTFAENEIIVSKTDLKGRLIYVNDVFLAVSGYSEQELIGQPHSIIRHPQTPRCVFKFLWDRIQKDQEVFVYVDNRSSNGDHYWVFAHVTPNFDLAGTKTGYHSNRRVPKREAVTKVQAIYETLYQEEQRHSDDKQGLIESYKMFGSVFTREGLSYDEIIFNL